MPVLYLLSKFGDFSNVLGYMVWAYVPTFNLDPETPKSLVAILLCQLHEKLDPDRNRFFCFFFFLSTALSCIFTFFCDFSHVFGCMVWALSPNL